MKRKIIMLTILSVLMVALIGCGTSEQTKEEVLRVGVIPNENASEMLKSNEPLKAHLEKELGMKVELFVATDYNGVVEAMTAGRLDIAYYGPLTYVLAKERSGAIPLVKALTKSGEPTYHSIIITRKDSGIEKVEDIKGQVFAFGDPASTSSSLMPSTVLEQHGINYKTDITAVYTGGHDAVALAVLNKNAAAGGLNQITYEELVEKGTVNGDEIKVLHQSKPIPEYPWAARKDLDPALIEKLIEIFLAIDDEAILKPLKASGFVKAEDGDYNVIREVVDILGIDLSTI